MGRIKRWKVEDRVMDNSVNHTKEGTVPSQTPKGHSLTSRESEILCLLARGQNTPQIARALVISKKTVEHHLTHIYTKIGVTCRTAAVVYAVQQGLV